MAEEFVQFTPQAIVRSFDDPTPLLDLQAPLEYGVKDKEEVELRNELYDATIRIAKFAQVHKIPPDNLDPSLRTNDVEYFRVDSGMNINVPRGRIKALRFFLSFYADGRQSDDVWVLDGFPNDKIKRVTIVSGKVKVGMNNLLKMIPFTQPIAGLLDIDINPWEFNWGYNTLEIGFADKYHYDVDWYLSGENVNQGFNYYLTIRKKNTARDVYAVAKAIWEYEPQGQGIIAWLKRRFGIGEVTIKGEQGNLGIIKV